MSRVYQGKKNHWYIDYLDADGLRHRKRIAPGKRIAEEVLNQTLDKVAKHQYLGVIEDAGLSFAEFADTWFNRIKATLRPLTQTRWLGIVQLHLKPAFKGSLRALTLAAIESYVAARLEAQASPATVNREVSVLRHILKRAIAWRYLHQYPLEGWKPLAEPSGRTKCLTAEEIERLLVACGKSRSPYLKPFVLVSLNTAMRRAEVLSLTRSTIDWRNRIANVEMTKNGEAAHVRLNETAFEALRSLPARLDGRLFPLKDGHTVSRAFRCAVAKAASSISTCMTCDIPA